MSFTESIRICFSKYVTFSGRAIRSEYWYFTLFLLISGFVLGIIDAILFGGIAEEFSPISSLFSLATFLPALAVAARRLHDSDRSGWWQIAPIGAAILTGILAATETYILAAAVGAFAAVSIILLLVWLIRAGVPGSNRFGPDPFDRHPPDDSGSYSQSSIPRVR